MPRAPTKCGHCREVGHNIKRCMEFVKDIHLYILGAVDQGYGGFWRIKGSFELKKINLKKLAEIKLLKEQNIPYIVWKDWINYPQLVVIRYENNIFRVTNADANESLESNCKDLLVANDNLIQGYINDYKTRIAHYRQHIRYGDHFTKEDVTTLLTGDYIAFTTRKETAQAEREEQMRQFEERMRQQRDQERRQREQQEGMGFENREPLPNIRETPFEIEDCPICFNTLGEVSKTILRCGHQLCVSCMLTHTLRSVAVRNRNRCLCPICRAPYL